MKQPERPSIIDDTQLARTIRTMAIIQRVNRGREIMQDPAAASIKELVEQGHTIADKPTRAAVTELGRRVLDTDAQTE